MLALRREILGGKHPDTVRSIKKKEKSTILPSHNLAEASERRCRYDARETRPKWPSTNIHGFGRFLGFSHHELQKRGYDSQYDDSHDAKHFWSSRFGIANMLISHTVLLLCIAMFYAYYILSSCRINDPLLMCYRT